MIDRKVVPFPQGNRPVGMIACTRRNRRTKCKWCGNLATSLCDHRLEVPAACPEHAGTRGVRADRIGASSGCELCRFTCDAPMCSACRQHLTPTFDLCPDHRVLQPKRTSITP